jgi:hypothetical protein
MERVYSRAGVEKYKMNLDYIIALEGKEVVRNDKDVSKEHSLN